MLNSQNYYLVIYFDMNYIFTMQYLKTNKILMISMTFCSLFILWWYQKIQEMWFLSTILSTFEQIPIDVHLVCMKIGN